MDGTKTRQPRGRSGTFRPTRAGYRATQPVRLRLPEDLLPTWQNLDPEQRDRLVERALRNIPR